MDRDIKIGLIVIFIIIVTIVFWRMNSPMEVCLQRGAEARGYSSFDVASNSDAYTIWAVCNRKI